ncbi:MAG: hypothetical protein MSS13_00885 [Sutterella parvirubra]|jgi:uncharacterized membrane protein|uniref:Uncharacterized protein n=1 Tax=Sutterella parvirubra YIT 11816 TaxID=762967 RepID=H3KG17_9BURK|nr:hypothetical protein [Sutterella parvirubra]EHY30943.1 hypothetical protein HMPREF9440_01691 [Sutterella parvirubra YIT 11816]MCI7708276.1 hypothetical protein [Sutterella parvirubra]MDR3770471.1 hypothetical protein [Sutterella sp.]MDY5200813.1 hypothetical protein [Sutterella parvirubra]
MTMKAELNRLQSLIEQLIARLQNERGLNQQLRNQLATREAELARTRAQLQDVRSRMEGMLAQFNRPTDER